MTIDAIITEILQREGWPTVTNRAADKGGLTKGGVTYTSYSRWLKTQGRVTNPTDFVNISEDDARTFLIDSIAAQFRAVEKVDARLFALMFDWATTSGPDDPVRALQAALRATSPELAIDGRYGSSTDAALRQWVTTGDVTALSRAVAVSRVKFYVRLAMDRDPDVRQFRNENPTTQLENVNGWVNRALEFV